MKWTASKVRKTWLDFFKENNHLEVESQSLIPMNDNSLLWINSGVATLKKFFSGQENPPYPNLTNSQKCIRTNDIFNVGVTSRHQTFFEMLGNFSIGGYFKEHAIELAFKLLTTKYMLPVEKLYITVYEEDLISYEKWINLGIDKKHIIKCDRSRNFWDIGSGPCGPCTEIYYDRGEKYDKEKIGEKLFFDDIENDRYVEIWNIVFSEFNNDGKGNYTQLSRKNIDTGAGLERLCCILQDVPTNFDTDLFKNIINSIQKFSDKKYDENAYFTNDQEKNSINMAYKIIADHARALVMAINDGAIPSNKDRGYILRRLLRRLIVKQHFLKINQNKFDVIVKSTVDTLKDYYPSLLENVNRIIDILNNEYNIFQKTLKAGFKLFNDNLKSKNLDKHVVFKLVETYGFPIELIQELANEHQIKIDLDGFEELFRQHQITSNSRKNINNMEQQNAELLALKDEAKFYYDKTSIDNAKIIKLYDDEFNRVNELLDSGWVVFDNTCFYATSGGQMHDVGTINKSIIVDDVIKGPNLQHIHHVILNNQRLKLNDICELEIDKHKRQLVTNNHSVEHLLHKTLVNLIDPSIKQEGAFKSFEKVTFDFQYHKKITNEDIKKIENEINNIIKKAVDVDVLFLDLDEAKRMGAMAYFEDVYKKIKGKLRVIKIGDISLELCGGTHVKNTKEIEQFKIIDCYQRGASSYRIEAITSFETIKQYEEMMKNKLNAKVNKILESLKDMNIIDEKLTKKINLLNEENDLEKKESLFNAIEKDYNVIKTEFIRNMRNNESKIVKNELLKENGEIVIKSFENLDIKNISTALNECCNEKKQTIFIVLNKLSDKTQYLLSTNETYAKNNNINLNNYIKKINEKYDGKGGGKFFFVQGGCSQQIDVNDIAKLIKNV